MTRRAVWVLFAALVAVVAGSKNAYVTIHYEGTKADAEYILGIRVLLRSLQSTGTKQDLVVLTSSTVSESSKALFRREGAIVRNVPDIDNPFASERRTTYKDRFKFTLNKLYIWNMTEYDRVVYLDADNIATTATDPLFRCGSFCVVFMNPCHFHTGLMVVKPDTREFNRLLYELGRSFSYDGADQGFLTAVYEASMLRAPLFSPDQPPYDGPQRLMPQENFNHIWFYERDSFDGVRFGRFQSLEPPVTTIAFPVAPVGKPWYWYGYLFLSVHWRWYAVRRELGEDFAVETALRLLLLAPILWVLSRIVRAAWAIGLLDRPIYHLRAFADGHTAGAAIVGSVAVLATILPPLTTVPALYPPPHAWGIALTFQHALVALLCGSFSDDLSLPMHRWGFPPATRRWLAALDRHADAKEHGPAAFSINAFAYVLIATASHQVLVFSVVRPLVYRSLLFLAVYALHGYLIIARLRATRRRDSILAAHAREYRLSSDFLDLPFVDGVGPEAGAPVE